MAISAKAVRVFAAVEVLRDSNADVRHALATLFEPDLALFNGQVFDPGRLSEQINNQYKLGITPDVVAGFTEIFLARGWLKQVVEGENVAFVVNCSLSTTVTDEVREFGERATRIAIEFREFIREISPLSQINKSNEELVDDLVDWLMILDRVTEEDLRTALTSRYKVGTKIFVNYGGNDSENISESTFLSARFVEHLFNS